MSINLAPVGGIMLPHPSIAPAWGICRASLYRKKVVVGAGSQSIQASDTFLIAKANQAGTDDSSETERQPVGCDAGRDRRRRRPVDQNWPIAMPLGVDLAG